MKLVRLFLRGALAVLAIVILVPLCFLLEAHFEMRRVARPLPDPAALLDFGRGDAEADNGPERVRYVQSGKQPRGNGAHSTTGGFVLTWQDGRQFAIDLGMSREAMRAFSRGLEIAMGAGPAEVSGSVAEQLGEEVERFAGVGFTHLHTDHTEGAIELCAARSGRGVPAFQTVDQFERQNYTTSMGRDELEAAGCIEPRRLEGTRALIPIPGFPGLAAFAAGGHTPGSTVWVVRMPDRLIVFAGDITNVHDDLMENRPKGFVYSYLMIPESTGRLDTLRRWLAALHTPPGVEIVVSHDLEAIERSRIPVLPGDGGERS